MSESQGLDLVALSEKVSSSYDKIKSNQYVEKYWTSVALLLIFAIGLYIRAQSLKPLADCIEGMVCLQALDPFYIYRTALDMMNNNFHLVFDTLRYFPTGMDPHNTAPGIFYLPVFMYKMISVLIPSLSFYEWAKWYPAIMGAFMGLAMYLLGKELFNKKIGLLAGLLLAVNASTLYRTAAGFIEKEPSSAVFIILAFYFFAHALNKNSTLSAINAGLSLLMVNFIWGGASIIYLILAMITGILVFFNIHPKAIYKSYPIMIFIAVFIPAIVNVPASMIYTGSYALLSFCVVAFVLIRYLIEKRNIVSKKDMNYAMPVISVIGLVLTLIGSFFSKTLASIFHTISKLLNWDEGVIGSTVAENNPATWANIKAQLGAEYAQYLTPQLNSIIPYMSLWIFMLVGIVFLAYRLYKTRNWKYMFALVWVVASIYASFARIRIIFLLGAPAALAGAFGIYYMIKTFNDADFVKNFKKIDIGGLKVNILKAIPVIFVILLLIVNLSAGMAFSKSIGPSLNKNWQGASQFLKTETPVDSVILSWWDYGYWFETSGERASVADGGNEKGGEINPILANGFISENLSDLKEVIEYFPADYVVVDYTLIDKFSAMSKIGHGGEKVNSFIPLTLAKSVPKGNTTIMAYQLGTNSIYVPVTQEGGIAGDIKFVTPQGTAHIKGLCTANGFVDLKPEEPIYDACLMFTPFGVYLPYPEMEAGLSNFAKLYLFDGVGVPFLEKVYDNTEIKIFKVIDVSDEIETLPQIEIVDETDASIETTEVINESNELINETIEVINESIESTTNESNMSVAEE